MAADFNANFDDNIINLIEKPEEKFIKSPRYQSIHKERMKYEIAKSKSAHQTLGVPKVPLKSPKDFLKKKSHLKKEKPKVDHVHYRRPDYQHNLPKWIPVKICPASSDGQLEEFPRDPVKLSRLNFRKRNIENAKNYFSKPMKLKEVYTRRGDNHELVRSGLLPSYIYKKNYGRVPTYLKKYSSATSPCQPSKQNANEEFLKNSCRYVTQEEREKLLKGMKKHWSEIMKKFQCLPFLIDTAPKIKRKLIMEEQLKQLEKDIDLLENHRYIYVCNDEDMKR